MKAHTFSTLLALASGAAATFSVDSTPFHAPSNTYDECTSSQGSGYDWSDLSTGTFSNYKGFNFGGWSCQNSFGGGSKRNLAARNSGFQEKCITGHTSSDVGSCPQISCGSGGPSAFTIDHVQVSVEFDCDLEFHYGMDDGSTCKTKTSCSTGGTTVKNSQCAGAKNVTVVLPKPPKAKPSCSIGFHSIGWNCATSSSTAPASISTPVCYGSNCGSSSTSTPPAPTTTPKSSICYGYNCAGSSTTTESTTTPSTTPSTTPESTSATSTSSESTTTPTTTPESSTCHGYNCGGSPPTPTESATTLETTTTPGCYGKDCGSSPTSSTPESSGPPACYGNDCGNSFTAPVYTPSSSTPPQYTPPSGPIYHNSSTHSIGPTTVPATAPTTVPTTAPTTAPTTVPTTAPITAPTALTTESYVAPTSVTSSSPIVTQVPCPDLLPSCMNTFLSSTGCSSNTDKDCYCPKSDFTTFVFDCLYAHGASDSEIYSAQTYFQGICAQYVPQNPALITSCPVTISSSISGPVTTISYVTTITISGESSTVSVYSSIATIPEVAFSTITGNSVGLITGTPAPIPAATTFASVTASAAAGTGYGSYTSTGSSPVFTGAAAHSHSGLHLAGAVIALAVLAL